MKNMKVFWGSLIAFSIIATVNSLSSYKLKKDNEQEIARIKERLLTVESNYEQTNTYQKKK